MAERTASSIQQANVITNNKKTNSGGRYFNVAKAKNTERHIIVNSLKKIFIHLFLLVFLF